MPRFRGPHWVGVCSWVCALLCIDATAAAKAVRVCVSHVLVYLPLIWYALFTFETKIWYFVRSLSLRRLRMNALCGAPPPLRALFRWMITHLFTSVFSYFFSFLFFRSTFCRCSARLWLVVEGTGGGERSQSVSLENLCAMNNFLLDIMVIYPLVIPPRPSSARSHLHAIRLSLFVVQILFVKIFSLISS